LCRELNIWGRLRHENVVLLLGTVSGFGPLPSMVCPWIPNGSLANYLKRWDKRLDTSHRLVLVLHLSYQSVHSQSVVHGDLHSDNVLIDQDGRALLTDFGLSLVVQEFLGTSYLQSSVQGCMRYAAPELFTPLFSGISILVYPTKPADLYSFGSVMLHVLTSHKPFDGVPTLVIQDKVTKGERPQFPQNHKLHADHHAFIERCWAVATNERPSAEEAAAFIQYQIMGYLILNRKWTGDGPQWRPVFPS
ncbi:kinase-like domain-containing protein, partial [Melanogaster broomeanus]